MCLEQGAGAKRARLQRGSRAGQAELHALQRRAVGSGGRAQRAQARLQRAQRLLPRQRQLERARQRRALARRVRRRVLPVARCRR